MLADSMKPKGGRLSKLKSKVRKLFGKKKKKPQPQQQQQQQQQQQSAAESQAQSESAAPASQGQQAYSWMDDPDRGYRFPEPKPPRKFNQYRIVKGAFRCW